MYTPRNVPPDPKELPEFLNQELRNISQAQQAPVFVLSLAISRKEPARLWDGMAVIADGTDWNPGSGSGFYYRLGGVWIKAG